MRTSPLAFARSSRLMLTCASALVVPAIATAASAQTSPAPVSAAASVSSTPATAPTVPPAAAAPVAAPVQASPAEIAAALASTSVDIARATNVAPVKSGKCGASFNIYAAPAATGKPIATLQNCKKISGRVVFTVLEDLDTWLKVRAPMRANGGVGYVQSSLIDRRFNHDWKIRVEIGAKRLTLTKGATVVLVDSVAVGASKTPTPTGTFFTVDLLQPKKAKAYGPFAYGLSGYSPVYQKFGSGDGRVGIHGTNEPGSIGKAISNGCIRVSNVTITKMARLLPLGVPVEIVA